ncbi:MAG: GAF domain-containing protein [Verrucomicrobia bacterium]|nr:GAF domain-containing protein [Verrucomicrobiota bacterium]
MATAPLPESLVHLLQAAPLHEALQAVLTHFDCQAGTWHTLSGSSLHLKAACHIPPPVLAMIQDVPVGKGIAGLAAERVAPVSLCNLQTDTTGQARPQAKATGMEGSLAVPALDQHGNLFGVLGIAKAQPHDWTDEETTAVRQAADTIARR